MTSVIHTRTNPQTGKLEVVAETGRVVVSAYCANLVAQCEQARLAIARPLVTDLAKMRASVNKIDHELGRDSGELARISAPRPTDCALNYQPMFPVSVYWALMLSITGLELVINALAFDGLYGAWWSSWAQAGMVSFSVFAAGKISGKYLRQGMWREVGATLIFILANGLLAFTCMHLADLRGAAAHAGLAKAIANGEVLASTSLPEGMEGGFVLIVLLGYVATLALTYVQTDPDHLREQFSQRAKNLAKIIDALWNQRIELANKHNSLLAEGACDLEHELQNLIQAVHQFRDGNLRGNVQSPSYFGRALPLAAVKELYLGKMIDAEPEEIGAVMRRAK